MSRKGRIFISYRRDDAAGYARAIYDELVRRFSDERVFMDVDDIAAGQPFDEVIRRQVGAARVMLVLIGPRWRGPPDAASRLDDPADVVRQEVAAGLERGLQVIPLLLDGARMPAKSELPPPLAALSLRQALEISNSRFADDLQRLVSALHEATGVAAPKAAGPAGWGWKRMLILAAIGGLAAGLTVGAAWYLGPGRERPDINGEWQAEVDYDWPNAHYVERLVFGGEGEELKGSASFLGVPRGIVEGRAIPEGIRFVTRSTEVAGATSAQQVHRYTGTLLGDRIRFVMQTEGGSSEHVPVQFTATRKRPTP